MSSRRSSIRRTSGSASGPGSASAAWPGPTNPMPAWARRPPGRWQETGLTPLDIDALVVATCSPDRLLPSQACDLQALLGAKHAAAFDVQAACTGFLYALTVAEGLVASEQAEQVLVVASEKLTSIMDWTDRATAVLFGDGAGATLVRKSAGKRGIL